MNKISLFVYTAQQARLHAQQIMYYAIVRPILCIVMGHNSVCKITNASLLYHLDKSVQLISALSQGKQRDNIIYHTVVLKLCTATLLGHDNCNVSNATNSCIRTLRDVSLQKLLQRSGWLRSSVMVNGHVPPHKLHVT